MKRDKPEQASDSYIFPRDLPRTGTFLDSDPPFEDPDIHQNDIADTLKFKSPEDSEVFLNFET